MDFEKTVIEQLDKLVKEGHLEIVIKAQLEKTTEQIAKSLLSSYGDFGKALETKLKEALGLDLNNINLTSYNKMMENIITEHLNNSVAENAVIPIKNMIDKYFTGLEKKEWKLSEIIERFKEHIVGDADELKEGEIKLRLNGHDSTWIYFSDDDNSYTLAVEGNRGKVPGKVWNFGINDKKIDAFHEVVYNHTFNAFIMNLYAGEAIVIIDEEACDLYYSNSPD